MKKSLLALSLVATLGMSAGIHHSNGPKSGLNHDAIYPQKSVELSTPAKAPSRATDGAVINFAGDIYTWLRLSTSMNITYKAYIYITPEIATELAGNKIEEIEFSSVIQSGSTKAGSIFVYEDIEGEPVTSTAITVETADLDDPMPQIAALEVPYTIKAGQGFYFGYTVEKCRQNDYPVAVGDCFNQYAGYVQLFKNNGSPVDEPYSMYDEGYNLYLKAHTSGSVKGLEDLAFGYAAFAGEYTLPIVNPGESLPLDIYFQNLGDNDVKSIDYTLYLNGSPVSSGVAQGDIAPKVLDCISIYTPALQEGRNDIKVEVTKINSKASSEEFFVPVIASNEKYKRMFVVEEGTGTWCGYCPFGIMGMEYMAENYPDEFIGIAVHAGDELEVESYMPIGYNFSGYPGSIWNRDPLWEKYPGEDEFAQFYPAYWEGAQSAAKVELKASVDGDQIVCDANVQFGFSQNDADYKIAFVITEDGLQAEQSNYLSGQNGAPEPWKSFDEEVLWTYTDTARDIFDCFGIKNSVPASIEKGKSYSFRYGCSTSNVSDINQTAITALLLDGQTGVILNAARVKASDYSAVESIHADASKAHVSTANGRILVDGEYTSARVYSVGGSMIANGSAKVAKGMYIVVVDGIAHKVIVK